MSYATSRLACKSVTSCAPRDAGFCTPPRSSASSLASIRARSCSRRRSPKCARYTARVTFEFLCLSRSRASSASSQSMAAPWRSAWKSGRRSSRRPARSCPGRRQRAARGGRGRTAPGRWAGRPVSALVPAPRRARASRCDSRASGPCAWRASSSAGRSATSRAPCARAASARRSTTSVERPPRNHSTRGAVSEQTAGGVLASADWVDLVLDDAARRGVDFITLRGLAERLGVAGAGLGDFTGTARNGALASTSGRS